MRWSGKRRGEEGARLGVCGCGNEAEVAGAAAARTRSRWSVVAGCRVVSWFSWLAGKEVQMIFKKKVSILNPFEKCSTTFFTTSNLQGAPQQR